VATKSKTKYTYRMVHTFSTKKEADRNAKLLNGGVHPFMKKRTGLHYDVKPGAGVNNSKVYRVWARQHKVKEKEYGHKI